MAINLGNAVTGSSALPSGMQVGYTYYRAVGYLVPTVTGQYTLGLNYSGGASLYLGNQAIVSDLTGNRTANTSTAYVNSNSIQLTAGVYYPIYVDWANGPDASYELQLLWTPPTGSIQVIPSANLSTSSTSITSNLGYSFWNGTVLQYYPSGPGVVPYGFAGFWVATVDYIVGDEVVQSGSYWKCVTANINSEPTLTNANWQNVGSTVVGIAAYNNGTTYYINNQVTYNGNVYTATQTTTGNLPTTATYWVLTGPQTLDNIADGATYRHVMNVTAGHLVSLDNAVDDSGTYKRNIVPQQTVNVSQNRLLVSAGAGTVYGRGPFAPAQDAWGNDNSWACPTSSLPTSITLDLGVIYPQLQRLVMSSYWIGDSRVIPSAGTVDVSNDNVNWTTNVGSWSNVAADPIVVYLAGVSPRYIRINITGAPLNPNGQTTVNLSGCVIYGMQGSPLQHLDYDVMDGTTYVKLGHVNSNHMLGSQGATQIFNSGVTTSTGNILTNSGSNYTINIAAFTVQYGFGQVSYNSGSVTPSGYGTYTVYFSDPTYAGGAVTYHATSQAYNSNANDSDVRIGAITISSGSGSGGGGGGGGGGICFSPHTLVKTWRGNVRFSELLVGDLVLTAKGTWRPIIGIISSDFKGEMLSMGNGWGLVTLGHLILQHGTWIRADELGSFSKIVNYEGKVMNLLVETSPDDELMSPTTEHSYTLSNGLVAHNVQS